MTRPPLAGKPLFHAISLLLLLLLLLSIASADRTYKSRPDLSPPKLNITVPASSQEIEAGYLFIAPYGLPFGSHAPAQPGPYILTDDGKDLIWSGFGYFAGWTANFRALTVAGAGQDDGQEGDGDSDVVLVAYEGAMNPLRGHGHGHHKILDSHYRHLREVRSGGYLLSDPHEFEVVQGGRTALVGSYTPREIDLRPFGGDASQTWILEYIFQEIDIETGAVLFEWHSLEHISPSESVFPLGSIAGSGHDSASAWDYIHINSIQKGSDGHYLLSGRHASAIYKIDGQNGSVVWRLGGLKSDFTLETRAAAFAWQHHARYLPGSNESAISLFDNSAGPGAGAGAGAHSTGKILDLDLHKRRASLRQVFEPPHFIFAESQGSVQILPSGNALVNWGSAGQITEYSGNGNGNGTIVFHAFLDSGLRQAGAQNYRAFRGNWTGYSSETPAVVAELDGEHGVTAVWVSWNGDTRTAVWRFRWDVGGTALDAPAAAGAGNGNSAEVLRQGFETMVTLPEGREYNDVIVEAVDGTGNILARTDAVKVSRKLDLSQTAVPGQHPLGDFGGSKVGDVWTEL